MGPFFFFFVFWVVVFSVCGGGAPSLPHPVPYPSTCPHPPPTHPHPLFKKFLCVCVCAPRGALASMQTHPSPCPLVPSLFFFPFCFGLVAPTGRCWCHWQCCKLHGAPLLCSPRPGTHVVLWGRRRGALLCPLCIKWSGGRCRCQWGHGPRGRAPPRQLPVPPAGGRQATVWWSENRVCLR